MLIGNSTPPTLNPNSEHFKIAINGKEHKNLELRQVKEGLSLEEAQSVLKSEKDGLDTIGLEIDGVNYLISGTGIEADVWDTVEIEGQASGTVAFVEQENNAFREGFKSGLKKMSKIGIQYSVAAAPAMAISGLAGGAIAVGRGMTAKTDVLEKITDGPVITPQAIIEMIDALDSLMGF